MASEYVLWLLLSCLALGLSLDTLIPLRRLQLARRVRWSTNGLLYLMGMALAQLAVPGGTLAVAAWAGERGFGLLHHIQVPYWVALVGGVLLLDLAMYWMHRVSHVWRWYWRLHRIHHTDVDVDVTTEFRHHPLETIITVGVMSTVVAVVGLAVETVLLRLLLTFPVSMFSHSNWLLPAGLDRALRWLIVTPAMHRIHHSSWQPETDSNFGQLLSVWDRLFGTYREAPRAGYVDMELGLERYRTPREQDLPGLLMNPLR